MSTDADLLSSVEFEQNTQSRCPVVLLLDTSGSMGGSPINELNEGLREFEQTLKADKLASLRVEVAVVTFGGAPRAIDVRMQQPTPFDEQSPFVTLDEFKAPHLTTSGDTPMCAGIRMAADLLRRRKDVYKQNGIDYYRPWLILITDGAPTDRTALPSTIDLVRNEVARRGFIFYPIGVENADMQVLTVLSPQLPPMKLKGLQFRELFNWLSGSLQKLSNSNPGDQISLAPASWGTIDTGVN